MSPCLWCLQQFMFMPAIMQDSRSGSRNLLQVNKVSYVHKNGCISVIRIGQCDTAEC